MDINFQDIINRNNSKIENLKNLSNNVVNKFNENNFIIDNDKIKLLMLISKNINNLTDELNDLYSISLNTCDNKMLTSEELKNKRSNKIDKLINDNFMPYIIFTRLCLENSSDV